MIRFAVLVSLLLALPAVAGARLADEAWRLAESVTDFVMKEPTEGGTPTDAMDVRLAYDDRAFDIGARTFNFNSRTLRNRDFNRLPFRSNVVLKWEWRPGSTPYVVWQRRRAGSEITGDHIGPRDMFRPLTASGTNLFVIKTSFWLPIG